jgi:hypothetical protein
MEPLSCREAPLWFKKSEQILPCSIVFRHAHACNYALRNARRSALIASDSVAGMPRRKPLLSRRQHVDFGCSVQIKPFAAAGAESLIAELSEVPWKRISKHRISAVGLLLGGFVLDDIPVLDQEAVVDTKNVRCNPVHGLAEARKSPMYDHEVFLGHNRARFVFQRRRQALDQIRQAFTTRCDVSAVLIVAPGPAPAPLFTIGPGSIDGW